MDVVSNKVGGTEVGFIIEDRAGVRYVLKSDSPGFPEQETGAHLVVSWCCGRAAIVCPTIDWSISSPAS